MNETRKPTVLLVDDEAHIRALMKALMKIVGTEVVAEAANGSEAVLLYDAFRPDLLLLDINMPDRTGEEVLEEIMEKDPQACVIMLTSLSDTDTVAKCVGLGAANFIRKDTPLEEMKEIIKDTLREFEIFM